MKILYITRGDHVDYQNDCLLIGLKELFGSDVVDVNKDSHIYESYPPENARYLYGMGFSITRILDDIEVDRTDIMSKLRNKYFDYIIYGSINRSPGSHPYFAELQFTNYLLESLEHYPKSRIIAIDGEDETNLHPIADLGIPYFKRELIFDKQNLFPIGFAIPESKINFNTPKIRDYSYINPLDRSTYIYGNEIDYYNDYRISKFGITLKKAGWDCMRHYEIMANGCIPLFLDIDKCPNSILTLFPKDLCSQVVADLKELNAGEVYDKYIHKFQTHLVENNTTKALAKYLINTLNKINN